MSKIGWGKPRIAVAKIGTGATWKEMPTPVQGSTAMNVEKGEKREALIEGGEVEDVKYDKNKHALVCTVRALTGRNIPIPHQDGEVEGEYILALQPEDKTVPSGIVIQTARVSVETQFSSEDGVSLVYTFDALKPKDSTSSEKTQIVLGEVEITGGTNSISTVKIKPYDSTTGAIAATAKTVDPVKGGIGNTAS